MGKNVLPWNFTWEPKNGGLEDDVPFQLGDFLGSMINFRGVKMSQPTCHKREPKLIRSGELLGFDSEHPTQEKLADQIIT